jgi:hypothetical protein
MLKRSNQQAKTERILNSLQPWYMAADIRFLDDLDSLCPGITQALETELDTFPAGKNDDILDTLSDIFQNKKHFGRGAQAPKSTPDDLHRMQQQALHRMLNGEPPGWDQSPFSSEGNFGYEL